jgi:hypothetical protein
MSEITFAACLSGSVGLGWAAAYFDMTGKTKLAMPAADLLT